MSTTTATSSAASPDKAGFPSVATTTVQVEVGDARTIILAADALVSSEEPPTPTAVVKAGPAVPQRPVVVSGALLLSQNGGGRRKQAKPQKNKNGEEPDSYLLQRF